jgi:hypothetical protein
MFAACLPARLPACLPACPPACLLLSSCCWWLTQFTGYTQMGIQKLKENSSVYSGGTH